MYAANVELQPAHSAGREVFILRRKVREVDFLGNGKVKQVEETLGAVSRPRGCETWFASTDPLVPRASQEAAVREVLLQFGLHQPLGRARRGRRHRRGRRAPAHLRH